MSDYFSDYANSYTSELMNQANYKPSSTKGIYGDTVFSDKKSNDLTSQDFLNLMMEQLKNQDFMNPMSDTEFLAQLAQFTSMQYMQELAGYSKQNYVSSLVGQTVTAAKLTPGGELDTVTGKVTKVSLVDNEYKIYIDGKDFTMDQIMEIGAVGNSSSSGSATETPDEGDDVYTDQASFYLSLLGVNVTMKDLNGNEAKGVVDRVSLEDGVKLMVNGVWYGAADLVSVDAAQEQTPADEAVEGSEEEQSEDDFDPSEWGDRPYSFNVTVD